MRALALIILLTSLTAYADEGPMLTSVSVSGTSARTSADLGSGWKAFRCDVEVFFRTGNSSATAVTTDMPVPANTTRPVYITTGSEQRLAFITSGGSGTCRIYRLQVGPDGTPPDVMTVNGASISPSSVTISGFTAGGDAGFHNVVLSGASTVAGHTSGRDAGYHNIVASGNVTGPAWAVTSAGLISGNTPATAGTFPVSFLGTGAAVAEGANGLGGLQVTQVGLATKVGTVCCSCRVAGSGGTNGIFIALMEDGSEVDSVEVVAADSNACDDGARTLFCGSLDYTVAESSSYEGQFKSTTDCASNPTDCVCNFEVLR